MTPSAWLLIISTFGLSFGFVSSLEVLMLFPIESRSMRNIVKPLATGLHSKKHHVTIVSMYPGKPGELPDGTVEITVPDVWEIYSNLTDSFFAWSRDGSSQFFSNYREEADFISAVFLDHPMIRTWVTQPSPVFDVAIVNGIFSNYALPVGCKIAKKCMMLLPIEMTPWLSRGMGLPSPAAYVPASIEKQMMPLDFLARIYNTIAYGVTYLMVELQIYSKWNVQVKERFPNLKSIEEATNDVALMMVNVDTIVTVSKPTVPRVVNVGCLHCSEAKALQGELLKFVESSGNDGFIFFSLGSVVKGSTMPNATLNMFVSAFSKLKQKVVWKFEKDLHNLPENVRVFHWLPQQDVLGHPNIRLFISHGGLLSMEETVYHGVPVIAFPIFAEQPGNSARVVEKGIGSVLDIHSLTKEILLSTINEIIDDKSYMENAKKCSAISRDQPTSPIERAVHWVEYVSRHADLEHLQTPGSEFYLFQYYSLDILGCAFIIVLCPIICFYIGLKLK